LKSRPDKPAGDLDNDTIAAIATPTGSGGIGIVRISGPQSLAILNDIFDPQNPKSKPTPYMLRFGKIIGRKDRKALDEVLAVFMPGPKSFTGEDMVEIYCHAGQYMLKAILDNILACECRPAEAGEFSLRRFLNHGVDLSRLEGAAEVVASKTDLAYRLAREHLLGGYGEQIASLRTEIVRLLAELEADIDFPEEESVGRIGREMLETRLDDVIERLDQLSDGYRIGKMIRDGYRVVILGPPNSGKSSLFNRLVHESRALVTPIPGTTRDYISEWIDIDGLPVQLFDTAGLRTARGRVEKAGIESTRRLVGKADCILYLFDISGKLRSLPKIDLGRNQKMLILLNKVDLVEKEQYRAEKWQEKLPPGCEIMSISAKTGRGIKVLVRKIYDQAGVADLTDNLVVTSQRHKVKIDACLSHLKKIRTLTSMPTEIISFELRQAANQIGEITGAIYTEQILDEIFSSFCIGK
jgi:tRNA modification GTPase